MENNDKLIADLRHLEAIAYGYNLNGEVLGMDCSDFEQLMVDAANALANAQTTIASDQRIIHSLQQSCDKLAEENRHYRKQIILENKGQDLWSDENIRAERLAEENRQLQKHLDYFADESRKWEEKYLKQKEAKERHGRWISDGALIKCSECGKSPMSDYKEDYCPNCGARMDEEDEK